jgi:transketolase
LLVFSGSSIDGCYKGAYVLKNYGEGKPELILVGTGSEVHLCVGAAQKLGFPTSGKILLSLLKKY